MRQRANIELGLHPRIFGLDPSVAGEMKASHQPSWRPTLGGLYGDWYLEIADVSFSAVWTDGWEVVGDIDVDEFPMTVEDINRVRRAIEVGRAYFVDLVGIRPTYPPETDAVEFYTDVLDDQLVSGATPQWLAESGE